HEEIKQKSKDFNDRNLKDVEKVISALKTELIIPSYIEDKMLAVIALGKKRSGKLYTQEDLVVFSILANQSALAIENAQFYESTKKTHEQLFKAEKMATIGTMADGLSHQINNRLHAMGFIAGDILDTIKLTRKKGVSKKTDKVLKEIALGLNRIEDNVIRGGEIVQGLLKYTRKGTKGFEAVDLDKLISAAVEMAQFKIKISEIDINRGFNGNTPKLRGNFTQLQEVFFNVIDNSYDAMMQRKEEMKEPEYRGVINITAVISGTSLEINLSDNGMGVKESDKNKLFTPFFTTKLSSRKGTGLGLYVIKQIIEENHKGKVVFNSEYGVGTQTRILLPIAKI
ncbi:MAG: GHKL domain-containing protein, partial [Candidatus Omnitrophica bacterium]|nr:GHKL domain-containing protein [Candidatus Omnitrophota bacterium]